MKILHLLSGGGIGGIEMLCLNIAKLSRDQNEFCFLYSGGEIAEEMRQKGIPVYLYCEEQLAVRMWKLWKLVKKEQYDVVIVHHEGVGIYSFYLLLSYAFPKIKFMKYLHCAFEEQYFYVGNKFKDWLYYTLLKKTLLKSDCVIAVSEFVKKSYCEEFGYETDKVVVIYNGIQLGDSAKCVEEIQSDKVVKLLYIGRLVEVKGVRKLLEAVKQLLEEDQNIELDILGDGNERLQYEKFVFENHLESQVHFRGYQLDKEVYYRNNPIFVYPSIWQEAFGISIVEALAHGLICVASNVGGIPEIITDKQNGYLFEHDKENDLVNALKRAIAGQRNSSDTEMRKAAYARSLFFDIDNTIDMLQKVLRRCKEG